MKLGENKSYPRPQPSGRERSKAAITVEKRGELLPHIEHTTFVKAKTPEQIYQHRWKQRRGVRPMRASVR